MLIGAHVSPAGGLPKAVERGVELGAESIQIFNQSPRMWRPTAYGDDDFQAFRAALEPTPIRAVVIHAVYLVNCASEDKEIVKKSRASLIQSLRVGHGIGASGVVLHPGSAKQGDVGRAIKRAGKVIGQALGETEGCQLDLEDTAGAGGTLGRTFEELEALLDAAGGGPRLGVCLDSCHLLASGYDVRTSAALGQTLDDFDAVVGLKRLGSVHLNDSKAPLGSNRDRHELIGQGEIGERGCAAFLSEPRFERLPVILETRPSKGQIELCQRLRKRSLAARKRATGKRTTASGKVTMGSGKRTTASGKRAGARARKRKVG
ncbi:MAG: deoxyribonuclease IV [Solirubrobacteraceae bacterium]